MRFKKVDRSGNVHIVNVYVRPKIDNKNCYYWEYYRLDPETGIEETIAESPRFDTEQKAIEYFVEYLFLPTKGT